MNKLTAITTFSAVLIALIGIAFFTVPSNPFFDVMKDRHGEWRIPTNGAATQATTWIINKLPRLDISFTPLDITFDMDNEAYLQSSVMYIVIPGVIGLIFMIAIVAIMISRYFCNCCGGKNVRRKGYRESNINFYRYAIIVVSFGLEAVLIYGYFANADLHKGLSTLAASFNESSTKLKIQFEKVKLEPNINYSKTEAIKTNELQDDLDFSLRYAQGQTDITNGYYKSFEAWRMVVIILNLILSTVGCSLGIAAGSVRKGTPVVIMVILFAVSDCLFFFSFGIHLSGSKLLLDYCTEIAEYIAPSNDQFLPMRLQFFVPCVSSPVFPFIEDHFLYKSLTGVDEFIKQCKDSNCNNESNYTYIQWYNFTELDTKLVYEGVDEGKKENLAKLFTNTSSYTAAAVVIEDSVTCRFTKDEIYQDQFLLCVYTKDNLYMMMITQFAGCILLIILTILGIPAIKRFKYAGNANINGVLDANKRFMGRHAKAKRTV